MSVATERRKIDGRCSEVGDMCRQKSVGQRVQLAYNENRVPDEGRDEVGGRVESKAGAFVVDAGTTDD